MAWIHTIKNQPKQCKYDLLNHLYFIFDIYLIYFWPNNIRLTYFEYLMCDL